MKLANKTFCVIAATLGILIAVQAYLAREILMSGFEKLETRDAMANVDRFRDALQEQIDSLAVKVADWSMWDDAYDYVGNRNEEFEKSNLEDNTLSNLKVQLFLFLDAKNDVVFGRMVDVEGNTTELSAAMLAHLEQHPKLYTFHDENHHVNGMILLEGQPLLISSQPIIRSDGSGPIAGAIIVGRYLDQAAVEKLSQLIHLDLYITPAGREFPPDLAKVTSSLQTETDIILTVTSKELLTGYVFYNDLYGEKCFYAGVRIPRDVRKQAEATMLSFLSTMLLGGMLLTIITYWAMNRSVVQPIISLNKKIHMIGENGALSLRVPVEGQDEIASLAGEVNQMLDHIEESKTSMQRLLDHSKQGFLLFGPDGVIAKDFSRSVLGIFGVNPAGQHIAVLLQEDPDVWAEYSKSLFAEDLPFAELIVLCPNLLQVNERFVELEYIDIRDQENRITHVMVVATDVTSLRLLERQKEEESGLNRMLIKILVSKNDFLETLALLHGLRDFQHDLAEFRRRLHTIKGSFNSLLCTPFAESCQCWEEKLVKSPKSETAHEAQQAILSQVEAFIDQHDALLKIRGNVGTTRTVSTRVLHEVLSEAVRQHTPPAILDKLRQMTEIPAQEALGWIDDAFVAAATKAGKESRPALWLPSATIDTDLYSDLLRSLIHVPRNAADHSLETPDEREAQGKPRAGRLTLQLALQHDTYSMLIADDGAGVDISKVADKALQLGLPAPRTREEAFELLFADGLSTKETVTDLSGRGVGLSAVRAEARKLGGDVLFDSVTGQGTTIVVQFKRQELRV